MFSAVFPFVPLRVKLLAGDLRTAQDAPAFGLANLGGMTSNFCPCEPQLHLGPAKGL